MNGRQWILTGASQEARAQIRGALSLRGSRGRWGGPGLAAAAIGLWAGCASGGAGAGEVVAPAAASFAGADVVLARYVLEPAGSAGTVGSKGSVEFEVQRPDGLREVITRELRWSSPDDASAWLPAGVDPDDRALISVRVADATWRSASALPLGSVDPRSFVAAGAGPLAVNAPGAESAATFARYCERLTLHRDPSSGAPAPGGIARAWFGGLVASSSAEAPPVALTLADVTVALFARENKDGARALVESGWHVPSADAAWATPRWLALHDIIGEGPFREALRRLVDTHGGRAPIGIAEVAASFEGEDAQAFVNAWFRGPSRPRVETSWRHDSERRRVLLRVDQTHEIKGDAIAAYSFTLPVVIVTREGETIERSVTVERRRELFEIPFEGTPVDVRVDPDATLASRIELVPDGGV